MAFVYYKYLTGFTNTIVAVSPTPFTLGPGEGQIFTSFEIPAIQPLYLYAESGGNVVTNSDSVINAYLGSIGQQSSETVFTGYTASTNTRLNHIESNIVYLSGQTALKLNTSAFNTYSAATQTTINGKLSTSAFNTYSAATLTNIQSRLLTGAFNTYSASTLTNIQSRLLTSAFNTYSGNTANLINTKLNSSLFNTYTGTTAPATYLKISNFNPYSASTLTNIQSRLLTSAFNTYSAATQTTINGKLNITDFNVYSANTLSLIQSSQSGLDPKQSVRVATTAALSGGTTYIATGGTAGTGRFTGAPSRIDGVILANGNRVLVKNQADQRQNGIYSVISAGVWNRASDQNGVPTTNVSAGNYTFVETGTTFMGTGWAVLGDGVLTLNTDPIRWTQFNSATAYVAGTGILIAGQTISFDGANVAGNALTWSGTQLNVNPTGGTLGTKFNTKLDVSAFNTYSAATLTNIQSRLLTSAFNTYSGNTANLINTKVGSANNGIRKTGTNVYLGGSLTGSTNLGLGTFNLVLTGTTGTLRYGSDLSAQYNVRSLVDKGFVTGITSTLLTISAFNTYSAATLTNINSRLLTSAFNTYSGNTANLINTKVGSANNGIRKSGTNVYLGGSLTGSTNLGLGTFNLILTGTTGTLRYGSDLSAQYNVRSLVDKGFVTGITSTLLTISAFNTYSGNTAVILNTKVDTANNGLTKVGRNVRLGGTLTGATTIGLGTNNLTLSGTTGVLKYATDQSANFDKRTLIDKGYYTGNTLQSSAQILVYASGVTDINVTTAVSIPLNRLIRNNSSVFTYTGGTAIKILVAGTYDVSYIINGSNSNATAHSIAANLYKNGSAIAETTTTCSTIATTAAGAALALPSTQITFAANDIIHLRGFRLITGGGSFNTTANSVFLSIVKKY